MDLARNKLPTETLTGIQIPVTDGDSHNRCIDKDSSPLRAVNNYLWGIRRLREKRIRKKSTSRRQHVSSTFQKRNGHAKIITSDRSQAFLGNIVQEGIGKNCSQAELHMRKSSEK